MDLLDETLAIINKSFENRNIPPKKESKSIQFYYNSRKSYGNNTIKSLKSPQFNPSNSDKPDTINLIKLMQISHAHAHAHTHKFFFLG